MTEQEAKAECARLAATHPDHHSHRWAPTKLGDGWVVAKIALPPTPTDRVAEIRADERPPTPDDPSPETPWLIPPSGGFA